MPDSTESKPSSQRKPNYRRMRWQRALDDTRQFIVARSTWGVIVAIGAALMSFPLSLYRGKLIVMNAALDGIILAFAAIGFACLLCLRYYWLAAPSRIYREDQKEIAELKSQLEQRLDLDVNVPHIFTKNPADLLHLQFSQDGLAIVLRDIRFTNRSATHNVSLHLTLMVPGRGGYYRIEEEKVYWKILPDYLIFSPIGIAPGVTQSGDVCFLVSQETVRNCGGKWKLNYKHCRLEIFDLVSEKKMDKDISQEALESQQSIRDTPVWYNKE